LADGAKVRVQNAPCWQELISAGASMSIVLVAIFLRFFFVNEEEASSILSS